jgi:hypothetical protein
MDSFQEFSNKVINHERKKREVVIGLFGSFKRDELRQLRDALLAENYNVRISSDLESEIHPKPGMSADAYNYELSIALIEQCDIHIFLFHRELKGEHNINQSASMELQYLATRNNNQNVLVLLEDGYIKQSRGVFKGLKSNTSGKWRWRTYRHFETLKDAAVKFSFSRILSFSHSDNSLKGKA